MSEFEDRMTQYLGFEPTSSQSEAIQSLSNFFTHVEDTRWDDHAIFVLRGYAGTGKSTLVGALARTVLSYGRDLTLLAPTGRAAKVLQGYCGLPAHTIHHEIYRERTSAEGESSFERDYNKSRKGTIYIVDEASMISNSSDGLNPFGSGCLLDDLIEYCFSVEGSRLLFIGDDAQLPPIGTELSPAMDTSYLARYSPRVYSSTLTDIVRQARESEIVLLSHHLRLRIMQGIWRLESNESLLPLPEGRQVSLLAPRDVPEAVEESYRKVGIDDTVILTRSNRDAEAFNRDIRRRSLDYEGEIISQERLMVCRNNYYYTPVNDEGHPTQTFIANGELLKVLHARGTRKLYGFNFKEVEMNDYQGNFLRAQVILEALFSGIAALSQEQRQQLYDQVALDYAHISSKRELYKALRKDPYLNALQVKYAYAMTCHKAQGGQWQDVYLHFGYLTPEMVDLSFLRWLYTAMTRATRHLYIIAPPSFLFGDLDL